VGERPGAVEDVEVTSTFWRDRSVFVTGHTGFKGGWLTLCLLDAGARVHGYSLEPPTDPNLFTLADVARGLATHTIADVRDAASLRERIRAARPSVVFHLAAQPLVRESYRDPAATYAVNVMGTVHLLEAVRATPGVAAVVNVTTDKCYENREWDWGYRESEPLGWRDPYSNSKACSELVTAAYRDSFLDAAGVAVASARAGNVIGGGDWAADRLVPDFFRAIERGQPLEVRYPSATRPWQHVLEPVSGYLTLAEQLVTNGAKLAQAWNFGPSDDDARPDRRLVFGIAALRRYARALHRANPCPPRRAAPLKPVCRDSPSPRRLSPASSSSSGSGWPTSEASSAASSARRSSPVPDSTAPSRR